MSDIDSGGGTSNEMPAVSSQSMGVGSEGGGFRAEISDTRLDCNGGWIF